jgi:hypothetical protein
MRELFRGRKEKVKRGWGEASLGTGVDHFWLTGARDEGSSEDTLDLEVSPGRVTRVNSTNVLDEGLRIGGVRRRMNSKVNSVKQGVYWK